MSLSTSFPLASRQWQRQSLALASEASSTELCLQCPCMLSKILRLFSRLFWKKKTKISPATRTCTSSFFCTNGITPFMEVLIITPRPRTLFSTKSPWFHLGNGATPAGTCSRVRVRRVVPKNIQPARTKCSWTTTLTGKLSSFGRDPRRSFCFE